MKIRRKPKPKRTGLLGAGCLFALVPLLALAGCGGSGGSTNSTTATTSGFAGGGAPFGGKNSKFVSCLKEHGVELPSAPGAGGVPPGRPGTPSNFASGTPKGASSPKMREAFEKCRVNLPRGGSFAAGRAPFGGAFNSKFASCLKEHGVQLPSAPQGGSGSPPHFFGGGQAGKPSAKMREAFEKCGTYKFRGGRPPGPPNTNSATFRKSLTEYVACVRKNGYDLPEPNLSGKGPVFSPSKVNQEDPKFKAASAKCANLLHAPGPGGGPG